MSWDYKGGWSHKVEGFEYQVEEVILDFIIVTSQKAWPEPMGDF